MEGEADKGRLRQKKRQTTCLPLSACLFLSASFYGILTVCPGLSTLRRPSPLACMSDATGTWYRDAIVHSYSPLRTTCICRTSVPRGDAVTAGRVGGGVRGRARAREGRRRTGSSSR